MSASSCLDSTAVGNFAGHAIAGRGRACRFEVARLQLQLDAAFEDAQASRARIVAATAEERQRLERDLDDGAQQRIVAIGM